MTHHQDLRAVDVLGRRVAYVDTAPDRDGTCFLFLHGNPTSSFLWRDVIPHITDLGRCVAPDLIGMGASEKLPGAGDDRYRFVEHRRYLDAFIEAMGLGDDVVLVLHDWGSGLGFDWANRQRDRVAGIAYMEAIVAPIASWDDWPDSGQDIFRAMRSDDGETICLDKNVFVERILPASVLRDLDDEEMAVYREPYREPGEDRRPTLTWPRELPVAGTPPDVTEIVTSYADWLAETDVPTLFVRGEPGFLTPLMAQTCASWPNQRMVTVAGIHFLQEDSPREIGAAIADWYREDVAAG